MSNISDAIYKIGEDMVKNHPQYSDVVYDPKNGIVPRCLIYEEEEGHVLPVPGSVIIGINPGHATKWEREFYKKHGPTYEATLKCWDEKIKNHPYYVRGRALVDSIGLHGPILWTELVKCESLPDNTVLSVQTIRDSINRYLFKELEVIPKNWPLIAVGSEVFKILGYRFPERTVIGIPHITGSYGQFHKLFSKNKLNPKAEKQLNEVLASKKPIATAFKCRGGTCRFDYS